MGLFDQIGKLFDVLDDDVLEILKHEGGEAAARHLTKKKKPVILKAYDEAIAGGATGREACLAAFEEGVARTL